MPSLPKLRNTFVFLMTRIDNLGLLYVKPIFISSKDSSVTLNKVWVTLYMCPASHGIILDLLSILDSHSLKAVVGL